MGFAVIVAFILLLWFGVSLSRKVDTSSILVQPSVLTPQQITDNYLKELNNLEAALADPNITRVAAEKKMNDFFFSVHVPDTVRDVHLATVIKFKSDSKLTIANWHELIINLRSQIANVKL